MGKKTFIFEGTSVVSGIGFNTYAVEAETEEEARSLIRANPGKYLEDQYETEINLDSQHCVEELIDTYEEE